MKFKAKQVEHAVELKIKEVFKSPNGNNGAQREFWVEAETRPTWLARSGGQVIITVGLTGYVQVAVSYQVFGNDAYWTKQVKACTLKEVVKAIDLLLLMVRGTGKARHLQVAGFKKM